MFFRVLKGKPVVAANVGQVFQDGPEVGAIGKKKAIETSEKQPEKWSWQSHVLHTLKPHVGKERPEEELESGRSRLGKVERGPGGDLQRIDTHHCPHNVFDVDQVHGAPLGVG